MASSKDWAAEAAKFGGVVQGQAQGVAAPDSATAPPAASPQAMPRFAANSPAAMLLRRFSQPLPDIAAAGTSFLPWPLSVPAGAAVGAGGKYLQQQIQGRPTDVLEMTAEAGKQAAFNAIPFGAARYGRALYKGALRPTATLVGRFPKIEEQMWRLRIPLGAGKAGERAAGKAMAEATATRDAMLDMAEQKGFRLDPDSFTRHLQKLINDVAKSGHNVPERLSILSDRVRRLYRDNPGLLTPQQGKRLLVALQDDAKAAWSAQSQGLKFLGPEEAQATKALERGLREDLRKMPPMGRKTFREAEEGVQSASAALAGVKHSARRARMGLPADIPMVPGHVQGFTIPRQLRTTAGISNLALLLGHPLFNQGLGLGARGLDAALLQPANPDSLEDR